MRWSVHEVRAGGARLRVEAGLPDTHASPLGWAIVPHQAGGSARPAAEAGLLAVLHRGGLATLSVDLLLPAEALSAEAGFNTALLGARLAAVTRWLAATAEGRGRRVGYVAAGQAAAAALWAAAELRTEVAAVVTLGGRVDLAARRLAEVVAPVLLVVNRHDRLVLSANRGAHCQLNPASRLVVAPSFRYLRYWLGEPAGLDRALAREWLSQHVLEQAALTQRPRLTDWVAGLNLRGKALAGATVLALLASMAGPAQVVEASTAGASSNVLTFTATAGTSNNLSIDYFFFGEFWLTEYGYYITDNNGHAITLTGTGCTQNGANGVRCVAFSQVFGSITADNFDSVVINLGDQNDTVTLLASGLPLTLNGEAGADIFNVRYSAGNATVNTGSGDDTVNLGSAAPGVDGFLSGLGDGVHVQGGDNDVLNLGDKANPAATAVEFELGGSGARTIASPGYSITLDASASPLGGGVNFYSGLGADTLDVESTRSGEKLTVLGHNFDGQYDLVRVGQDGNSAQGLQGPLHLSNPAEYSDVVIYNRNDGTGRTVNFSAGFPASLTGLTPAAITFTNADMRSVEVQLGSASDAVTIDGSWTNGVPGGQVARKFLGWFGNDVFKVTTTGATNGGFVDGEWDSDTVSYELFSSGMTVDLGLPTLPGFGLHLNMENATGGSGNDLLRGPVVGQNNVLNGGPGYDTVAASGNYHFTLDAGALTRQFVDTDSLQAIEAVRIDGSNSGEIIEVNPPASYDTTLIGNGGNDIIYGGNGNDYIDGGDNDDRLRGRLGNDTLYGGGGTDTLYEEQDFTTLHLFDNSMTGSLGTDVIGSAVNFVSLVGGNSASLIDLSEWTRSPVTVQSNGGEDTIHLGSGNHNDWIDGGPPGNSASDRIEQAGVVSAIPFPWAGGWRLLASGQGGTNFGDDTLLGIEGLVITGTAGSDALQLGIFTGLSVSLYGLAGDDQLLGGSSDDSLVGGPGNDVVLGGGGNDTVNGGTGDDDIDGGSEIDTMNLDIDQNVTLSGTAVTGDGNDTVISVEQLIVIGSGNPNLFDAGGYAGPITMLGNGGNDTLMVGSGGGSLDGGDGTDLLIAENDANITLSPSQLFKGSATFALNLIEAASLQGTESSDVLNASAFSGQTTLEGLGGNDSLSGGSNVDYILGGAANDALVGNAGHDTLEGGDGSDTLDGGANNDSLLGGADDDQLFGGSGNNTLKGEAGNDLLAGQDGNDSLQGDDGSDTLTGGRGANTLSGGAGDLDRLLETQALPGATGPYVITLTSSNLTVTGPLTTTSSVSEIELAHLVGGDLADTLDAATFPGQVTLQGLGGNDELSGALGNDSLDGGANTDVANFKVGNSSVTITGANFTGQGEDVLVSIEAFKILGGPAAQVFDASGFAPPAGGTLGVSLDGAGGNDTLIGSSYRDSLFGNDGNDWLIGNAEVDTLDGGAGTGDVVDASGTGPFTLANNSLTTGGVTDVLAQTESAIITGSLSADLFDTWAFTGRVTLVGDAGNDELRISTGGGSLLGGDGIDSVRVLGDTDFNLSNTQLEMLGQTFVLSSTESVSITAGVSANSVDASQYSGHVTLDGGGGADNLKGGAGNDLILGGAGDDLVGGGPGADTLDGGSHTLADTWVETGPVTVTLVSLGLPLVPVDVVSGLEKADFTGDGSPNIFNLIGFTGTATLKGGDGNDQLTGGNLGDLLKGEGGNDTLTGSAANDTIDGGDGINRLVGSGDVTFTLSPDRLEGTGTDTLSNIDEAYLTGFSGSSNFTASAFDGPVTLDGGPGEDTLIGGQVNDSVIGGAGDDRLEGRQGDDILSGLEGNDFLDGGIGQDLVNGYLGNDTVLGDDGNDTLLGAEGSDSVVGGAGDDLLSAGFDVLTTTVGLTMDDTLRGGPGLDTLEGGVGYDIVEEIGDASYELTNTSLKGAMGDDVLTDFEAARLTGGAGANLFNTLAFTGPVTLDGQGADDTFLAGAQSDSLIGGAGGGDQLHASGNFTFTLNDTLFNGLGTDTLSLVDQAIITGGVDANRLDAGLFTLGPVTLTGAGGNDTLIGGAKDDSLNAGDGDDTLTGNAGSNLLIGGSGNNQVVEASNVHFTLTNDLLVGTTTVPGGSLTDVLSNTASARLTGGSDGNLINAAAFTGTVTLDGGAGSDTLQGGLASDSLIGGSEDDWVVAAGDVNMTLTDTLLTGLGSDSLNSLEQASLTGGASPNTLDASAFTLGVVVLSGQDGDDWLRGGLLNDSLDGGPGNDTLGGGDGNDSFLGGAGAADVVDETVSGGGSFVLTPTLLTGRGSDTLTLIEGVRLTGGSAGNSLNAQAAAVPVTLTGGLGNDTLVGGALGDSLNGGADDDILTGGGGRDTLEAGTGSNDLLLETLNADTVLLNNFSLSSDIIGVPDGLVADVLVGGQFEKANITGGSLNNLMDVAGFSHPVTLSGLGGNDTLKGFSSADSLLGGDGSDTLLGGAGNNTLDGGAGNDSLLGGTGHESLLGGAGDDTMSAFAGSDTIDGGPNTDLLVEQVAGLVVLTDSSMTGLGTDSVINVEKISLTGSGGHDTLDASAFTFGTVTLNGGNGNDVLRGGSQADSLFGGEGNDSLSGNGGIDLLDGQGGDDWVVELIDGLATLTNTGLVTGLGTDTHLSIEHASLSGGLGADTLDASAYTLSPVILRGGDGPDRLIGTGLNDSLYGDGGDDQLDGRQGDDSLTGGGDTDTAVAAGDLNFTVTAASLAGNGTDGLAPDIEAVSLTGGAANNSFDLVNWLGSAIIAGDAGVDALSVGGSLGDDNFLIEAGQVIRGAASVAFTGIEHLVVNGGDGQDTLAIADSLAGAVGVASLNATPLTHVTLSGGEGDDFFRFKPLTAITVHVDGGNPVLGDTLGSGDTLEYDATGVALTQYEGQLLPQGFQPVSYTSIELLDLVRDFVMNYVFIPLILR